jgi:hypothetical protein
MRGNAWHVVVVHKVAQQVHLRWIEALHHNVNRCLRLWAVAQISQSPAHAHGIVRALGMDTEAMNTWCAAERALSSVVFAGR